MSRRGSESTRRSSDVSLRRRKDEKKHIKNMEENDDKCVLRGENIKIPPLTTSIGFFLWERIVTHKNKLLQIDGETEKSVRGDEMLAGAVGVALMLREMLGQSQGSVVAAALDNVPEATSVMLGTFFAAAIFAPVNPDLHEDDLYHILSALSPRVTFCAPRALGPVRAALSGSECEVIETAAGAADWEAVLRDREPQASAVRRFRPLRELPGGSGTALVMASSGTTGPPKGVAYTHQTLYSFVIIREEQSLRRRQKEMSREESLEARNMEKRVSVASVDMFVGDGEVTLVANPFSWISGLLPTLVSAASGWLIIQFTTFKVEAVLRALQDHRVTSVTMASPHISAIAAHPNSHLYDASSVALFRFGGSPLSPGVRMLAEEKIKKRLVFHYGLTECPLPVMGGLRSAEKLETVGIVAPNTDMKIVDYNTGNVVGRGVEGEICIKSSLMFSGYFRNPQATAQVVDAGGWLHTGDVGLFDEDGYLFIVDRYKELIKYKGIHIAPGDIERVLMRHEAVADAGVVGVEHDDDQERPVAFVALKNAPRTFVREEELTKILQDELPKYKHLYGGLYFGTQIPRTQGGKIKRRELRQLARTFRDKKLAVQDPKPSHSRA